MAPLWKFSRKSKKSTAQIQAKKSPSFPGTLQQSSVVSASGSDAISPTNQGGGHTESNKALRDLWQEALDNLDDEKKSALKLRFDENGRVQPCVTDAIQGVVTSVETSFEQYRNGGWKFRDRDGKVIFDVRESGKQILRFALRSKAIIDSGVKFDPTGYSSSAWAVISLGLQFIHNDQDRMSTVFDASALLAGILHRYANIEAHYRDQDLPDVMQLEDQLRSSYEAILNYVATVEEQRYQRFWGKATRACIHEP
ncbi:hypothetical protein BGZ61DRAFT_121986 [Ilyonectria robusta]|uniref:uncharacterized protein n=1 Tax=Ilyonectria robusta TaxID=1079257 RepID=UPI001E8CBE83|nr:uncharacterized protein BGZ61DRAFT_121986 [Ilyonectria robusta]KAH8666260.1 hypothetical protein BGZ61DRAFT_121986 [Ilyonectria robusta]